MKISRPTPAAGTPGIGDHGVRVYHSVNQSILNATSTPITFDSARWDTDAYHNPAVNPTRLTVPAGQAGKYQVTASIAWQSSLATSREMWFGVNGAVVHADNTLISVASGNVRQVTTAVLNLVAGDYVECFCYHESGGAINVLSYPQTSPEFMAQRIA